MGAGLFTATVPDIGNLTPQAQVHNPYTYLQGGKQMPPNLIFGQPGGDTPEPGFMQGLKNELGAAWGDMSGMQKIGTVGQVGLGLFNAFNTWNASKAQEKLLNGQLGLQRGMYNNAVKTTNADMEDRQTRRVSRSNGQAESVQSYMSRNRVG